MKLKFLMIPGEILRMSGIVTSNKILISIVYNFSKGGKPFFGRPGWLAEQLGVTEEQITKGFDELERLKIIRREDDEIILNYNLGELELWQKSQITSANCRENSAVLSMPETKQGRMSEVTPLQQILEVVRN